MMQYIYTSEARAAFSEKQIQDILRVSNENNLKHHVSGFLFYLHNHFLQILEGPEAGINVIYDKIAANKNHQILIESRCQTVKQTFFNKWTMGYDPSLNSIKGIKRFCKEYDIYHYETALFFLRRRLAQQRTIVRTTNIYNFPH